MDQDNGHPLRAVNPTMQFLGEHSSFKNKTGDFGGSWANDSIFLWIIVIATLIALNAFAWIFCMYVFGHPEVPFNYRLLTRLEKIEPISGFTPVTAPRGEFKTARQLYAEQYEYSPRKLKGLNAILKRNYISNFKNYPDIIYLGGNFKVEGVKVLGPGDVFPSGIAIRARAEDYPSALVDYILPVSGLEKSPFKIGDQLSIERSDTCAVLLHVEKLPDEEICFTITPLVNRDYQLAGDRALAVHPPDYLNMKGSWPVSPPSSALPRTSTPAAKGKAKVVIAPDKSPGDSSKN